MARRTKPVARASKPARGRASLRGTAVTPLADDQADDQLRAILAKSRVPQISLGLDIEQVARIEKMLKQHPQRFLDRVFTAAEVAHSQGRRNRAQHLAARFACKEAVMKALGTGLTSGITWRDIEVVSLPSGKPVVTLHGAAAKIAAARSLSQWEITLSHTKEIAAAVAIAW